LDPLETTMYIRSLYWPGFVAFHVLDTPNYGFMYVGTGKKNWDVPFMIFPPPLALKASVVDDNGEFPFEAVKDGEMLGEGEYDYENEEE
jgi:hypothetical protein